MNAASGSVWFSKLESEIHLTELFGKLVHFPDSEKTKVVISWLTNCFSDLLNPGATERVSQNDLVVHVKLVNSLVNNSSHEVASDLVTLFADTFLNGFLKPALLDVTQSVKKLGEVTHYYQLICENVSQPLLIRKIVKFSMQLLPELIRRLKADDAEILGPTLGLFRALLEFYCEDLWHDLILQHLLPMKHLIVSERQKSVPDIPFQESSDKFIDLIPSSILNTLAPEELSKHFMVYVQREIQRVHTTDATIFNSLPLSKSEVEKSFKIEIEDLEDGTTHFEQHVRNPIFPSWIFKYDGTDIQHATRKYKISEPEEYFEDDLFQFANAEDERDTPLSFNSELETDTFQFQLPTTAEDSIRVSAQPATSMIVRTSSDHSNQNCTDASLQWKGGEDQGHFGPFLESLFRILDNWTRLDPNVVLLLSEIFSVLASSRIPLISSMLLDFSIVLQPSFPSFHGIIHSIRSRLDGMSKYNSAIQDVWNTMLLSPSSSEPDLFPTRSSDEGMADAIREKITRSSAFTFMTQLTKNVNTRLNAKTRDEKGFDSEEDEIMSRKANSRRIIFAHWMLEMAAISQQACWFQSRQNQRDDE